MKGARMIVQPTVASSATSFRGSSRTVALATSSVATTWKCENPGRSAQQQPQKQQTRSLSPSTPRDFFHPSPNSNSLKIGLDKNPSCGFRGGGDISNNPHRTSLPTTETTTTTSSAPLLLEGDSYHISRDGISKTLYRLRSSSSRGVSSSGVPSWSLEEQYDLNHSRKRFLLRTDDEELRDTTNGFVTLGRTLHQVEIQEIGAGVVNGAGTGATTWESSFLMSMYFASHPEQLQGHVIELGSGVGLGSILCAMGPDSLPQMSQHTQSITLTDLNPMVLSQCQANVNAAKPKLKAPVHVTKLDWYDYLPSVMERPRYTHQFDTIIACDCAYRHRDIAALASTMRSLLRDNNSHIHIFGPRNRSGLEELLRLLREEYQLLVTVESMEMDRYRLVPQDEDDVLYHLPNQFPYAASYVSSFLHIVCSERPNATTTGETLTDID